MEKQRAKCWHNRSKFEQNTFSSQVGLIYIITPNASNVAVEDSLSLCFATEHKRLIYSNKTVTISTVCMMSLLSS